MLILEDRLLPYGEEVGDTLMTDVSELTMERSSPVYVVHHGLPMGASDVFEAIYVSKIEVFFVELKKNSLNE